MTKPEFTADQIADGIHAALADGHVDVVPGLLKMLAVQDPIRATQLLNTIEAGLTLARDPEASILDVLSGQTRAVGDRT